jgi:thiol-disulfide isomerase/thioredoxin
MKKLITKKNISNLIFILAMGIILYPPTREWFMRQIAFSPTINTNSTEILNDYDWNLQGLNTPNLNFNEYKGEVVFVNFWATWCPPCRAEMPMIQELYDAYQNKVKFVFITNENWDTVNTFFIDKNYNLPVYNSLTNPPSLFTQTNSIPATYIINTKGTVLVSKTGAANWSSDKVKKLLDDALKNK